MATRILIFGNSGSGKSTMARTLAEAYAAPSLDLDVITWKTPGVRQDLPISIAALDQYMNEHERWIIEGCYGSLIEHAATRCTELRFLNPGIETCLRNNETRSWEPHKYDSFNAQNEKLSYLQDWVRMYECRDDEFSSTVHRRIFDAFAGNKSEYRSCDPVVD